MKIIDKELKFTIEVMVSKYRRVITKLIKKYDIKIATLEIPFGNGRKRKTKLRIGK